MDKQQVQELIKETFESPFDKINNKTVLTKAKTIFNTWVYVIFFARHYGFTDKELDFIINYDIK